MAQQIPLVVAIGLSIAWISCIFYGVDGLYKRTSPVYIVYMGSWLCFYLWYLTWVKVNPNSGNAIVNCIAIGAIVMGLFFGIFSSDK